MGERDLLSGVLVPLYSTIVGTATRYLATSHCLALSTWRSLQSWLRTAMKSTSIRLLSTSVRLVQTGRRNGKTHYSKPGNVEFTTLTAATMTAESDQTVRSRTRLLTMTSSTPTTSSSW